MALARGLRELGFDSYLVVEKADAAVGIAVQEARYGMESTGVNLLILDDVEIPSVLPEAVRQLLVDRRRARILRRESFDLFINARFKSLLPGVGRRNLIYCHFPYSVTVEGRGLARSIYLGAVNWLRSCIQGGEFLSSYQGVLANSSFSARWVQKTWGRSATVVYPEVPIFDAGVGDKAKIVLSVGRFQPPAEHVPYKAQDFMIESWKSFEPEAPDWKLVLIGGLGDTPEEQGYFRSLLDSAVGASIELIPNATIGQVREAYSNAAIYWHAQGVGTDENLFPHEQEHFGISVVEAMGAGCIPLVHASGGPREIVSPDFEDLTWSDRIGLLAATRKVVGSTLTQREALRRSAERRAHEFDEAHFVDALRKAVVASHDATK